MTSTGELRRQLGFGSALALLVGEVIGVGIFLTPAGMARAIGSPFWLFAVWLAIGGITLAGAWCLSELAARYPAAGGLYVHLREAYGPGVAFLFGWMSLLVLDPGISAALASGFASYLGFAIELSPAGRIVVATAVLLALAAVNILGVQLGAGLLRWLTLLKVGMLLFIVCWGFGSGRGSWSNLIPVVAQRPGSMPLISGLAAGAVAAFFSFGGWWDISKMAGELRDPRRTLRRALLIGIPVVTGIYILICGVFLYLVPLAHVASDQTFAAQVGEALFDNVGGEVFSIVVMIAVLGSLAGIVMGAPRVYFAMARDGLFLRPVAAVSPRFGTPTRAIALQAIVACALVASGSFDQILGYFFFTAVAFVALSIAAILVLRRRWANADHRRPRAEVFMSLLFLVPISTILVLIGIQNPLRSLAGVCVVAIGIPIYLLVVRDRASAGRHANEFREALATPSAINNGNDDNS